MATQSNSELQGTSEEIKSLPVAPSKPTFEDGLSDGESFGIYKCYRVVMFMKKQHAPNSGAGRVLKELANKLKEGQL